MPLVVEQGQLGAGHGQADVAAVGRAVHRVARGRRAGLRQAVALADRAAGLLEPELGRGLLHRHAAADADLQVAPVDLVEVGVVGQRIEQGVDGRKAVDAVLRQLLQHGAEVARIGQQQVAAPHAHAQHHVGGETEDVIQRQRADGHDLLTGRDLAQRRLIPGLGLQHVGDQVAMQQHRPLADAGGAAGVLQHGNVVGAHLGRPQRLVAAGGQRVVEAQRAGQLPGRHHLLDVAHHVVDQGALQEAQHVAHGGHDHLLGGHHVGHLLQRGGKVLEDDDGLGAGILELVLEFARRIQGVDVDHHQAGAQDPGHRHRVLRHVGQHHGHAVTRGQAAGLQVGREGTRMVVDLAEGEGPAHEQVGLLVLVLAEALFQQRHQRGVEIGLDLGRDPRRVMLQPDLLHPGLRPLRTILTDGRRHQHQGIR